MNNNRPFIVDGKVKVPSRATLHDCMDFFHGITEDTKENQSLQRVRWHKSAKDAASMRWTPSKCIVRFDPKTENIVLRLSQTVMVPAKTQFFATIDSYGVNQYGHTTATPSNKIDAGATWDQACSNYWFALHHCVAYNADLLKKKVWQDTKIEEYIADEEKDDKALDVVKYLKYKAFVAIAFGAVFPVHAPLLPVRLTFWVHADKSIAKENRPKNRVGVSCYGGAPYVVSNGTISSSYMKFSPLTAPDYVKRINKETGMFVIEPGDFANMVVRFVGTPSLYSAAGKGDATFPNVMYYNLRVMPFDMSMLSKTVIGAGGVDTSDDDIERMKAMGAIIPVPETPAEQPAGGADGHTEHEFDDEEMSETERAVKRIKTEHHDE